MTHFLKGDNVGLISCRQQSTFNFQHIFVSRLISDMCFISLQTKETGYAFPLYLYSEIENQHSTEETSHRIPNLDNTLIKKIAEKLGLTFTAEKQPTSGVQTHEFGLRYLIDSQSLQHGNDNNTFAPIDILDYIYAVLHSPNYRETYKEFLKTDFPRVPYPDSKYFWQLVNKGSELRQLHLLESPVLDQLITQYPMNGLNCITAKINKNTFELTDNDNKCGKIWINTSQYFDNVPLTAWDFYVGGYQPVQKWLKDRQGRVLSFDDILHYQKIIKALTETARIMQEIDALII
jgi:predicted helicase